MSYTAHHAEQNRQMCAAAVPALHEVGWTPHDEPRNWQELAVNATYLVLRELPAEVTFRRARNQVLKVMAEYRGRKKAEWTK